MTTHVERSIEVEVPVRTAYDQWTQFEEFPRFMSGVQEVRQIGDALTHWVAEIGGVRREWDAAILEQVPDQKVAWAATTGATNAGAVYFQAVGADRTQVRLTLDYEPEGIVERVADVLDVVQRQAVADLDRFKEFIEQQGSASGGWRGRVDDGDVQGGTAGAAGDRAPDIPGDVVAVGPTGDTHGTLATEADGASAPTSVPDEGPGVGHSGDPVAVDPAASNEPLGTVAEADPTLTRTPSGVSVEGDPLVVDREQITARTDAVEGDPLVVDPDGITARTDAVDGDPVAADPQPSIPRTETVDGDPVAVDPAYAATGSPTAGAATSAAGAAGFGTDTGLRSDDPTSGALTGDPEARTAERPEER